MNDAALGSFVDRRDERANLIRTRRLPERTVFCIVRRRVTTLRLRSDRFTVWRARLAADFVFAIVNQKVMDVHARERIAIVNP